MKQPLVSVIMPVYNAGDYLVDAIRSIMGQTYKNFELIIINDASKDNSLEIIQKFQKRYSKKIRVIDLQRNLNRGGDMCANEGLKIARGKYIARMDADDISLPKRLEKQVAFLEKHRSYFLVGSNAYVIDQNRNIAGEKLEPKTHREIFESYFTFHPIIHPTAMYRRIFKGKRFFYKLKYSANNDYYTFFQLICSNHKFYNLQEKLLYYRIHGKNDTFVHVRRKFLNTLRVRFEIMTKYHYNPTSKQMFVCIAQAVALLLLPERISTFIYLVSKGIVKVENPFKHFAFLFKTKLSFR